MALATLHGVGLQYAAYYPPPLQIQKKPRKTTFHRLLLRRPTYNQRYPERECGPLDDIIDEIKSDIWESPPDYCLDPSLLDWTSPLQVPSTWTATPLPVSQNPSDRPLRVRKNRHSQSSTSGSSRGCSVGYSRHNSGMHGGPVSYPPSTTPWPLLDAVTSNEPTHMPSSFDATVHAGNTVSVVGQPGSDERRPSRLRLLTNGFSRLRRATGGTSASSPNTSLSLTLSEEDPEPSRKTVEEYAWSGRSAAKLGSIINRIAKYTPSPAEYRHDRTEHHSAADFKSSPATLRAAIRVLPEVKLLGEGEHQQFDVAIEIEGVLHNRKLLRDSSVDIVFIVDNAYYVSKSCLDNALEAINSALWYLEQGDRVALYATNCTHHTVSGNNPDLLWPIQPFCIDTPGKISELTTSVGECGTQTWYPPRSNPLMANVIIGVANSLESCELKSGRTHIVLLSPAMHVLHDVSKSLPELYVHQINPAALPYRSNVLSSGSACYEECCRNVSVSNWDHYQLPCSAIKKMLYHARSEKPVGDITKVQIDIRTKEGCELLQRTGATTFPVLRLGQVHTIFARVSVTRSSILEVNFNSKNLVFNSAIEEEELRQELQNAVTVGAVNAHLLDVQLLHRDSLHGTGYWNYVETPLFVIRHLGDLARPSDAALEVYRRQEFYRFGQLETAAAKAEVDGLLGTLPTDKNQDVMAIAQEIDNHGHVLQYEADFRQKLSPCPGPVSIEASAHEWLADIWNRKMSRRRGTIVTKETNISGLMDGLGGLERLG